MASFWEKLTAHWFRNSADNAAMKHEYGSGYGEVVDELEAEDQSPLVSTSQLVVNPTIEMEENMTSHRN
ncbi:hypothetical protein [Alkaliphilus hydrothermalis]|uniref:Uncharacterized protein n=1 Tax=Alkaliphilus hydrothermalis TaxID=1482730 RepID=A0ABS2NSV1_9FIRM|nr:hypothetical protein [Alkaliphilus hydrothermalis]MBM7616034.1 hypothetical protein [Alkaliphilus hydrothermalis]